MPDSVDHSIVEICIDNTDGTAIFSKLIGDVLQDMRKMGQFHVVLHQFNELIKAVHDARTMKDVRAQLTADLDCHLNLADHINKKFDDLVAANALQRQRAGSSDDQTRASMIADLSENVKHMMRNFQGLRVQMETDHRQLIESRYFTITGEKATAEAIDSLIASDAPGNHFHHAIQERGEEVVADAVEEIQVRRDTMREVGKSLMSLHQIFVGIVTAVDGMGVSGEALPNPIEVNAPAGTGKAAGRGGLNGYEREMRRQAYPFIAIVVVVTVTIFIALLEIENHLEKVDS